jgi:hypothetical protein
MIFVSNTIDCFEIARFVCYYLFLLCEYGTNLEVELGECEAQAERAIRKHVSTTREHGMLMQPFIACRTI